MPSGSALPLYNPVLLSDAQFVRGFVARQDQFRKLEERLAETPSKGLARHYLILGQRGMGKTSLLRRLALAVRINPVLCNRFVPLTFREEQYNVHNLGSFWGNCIDSLADFFEGSGKEDLAIALDQAAAALRVNPNGREHAAVLELFQHYAHMTGRRPMLFIDNIDVIFRAIGTDDWVLRRELQAPKGMIVVGASSALMEAVIDPQAAFYDFFQIEMLDRLRSHEVLDCLRQIALVRGETGRTVSETLEKDPVRVQVVASLAGGNPRTLAILYRILEADISHDVFEDIEYLLDEVTALYKSRIDDLAPQARVVLDAVALTWNPVSAADVANQTLLATAAVSTQLDRLERSGTIEKVPLPGTSRQGFQITERFFNIWYLMRHGPRRRRSQLRWLTEFLRSFYSASELRTQAQRMLQSAIEGGATGYNIFLALAEAIGIDAWSMFICTELRRAPAASPVDASALDELPTPSTTADWYEQARLLFNDIRDYTRAEVAARRALELTPGHSRSLNLIGRCRAQQGDLDAAEQAFQLALDADPLDWRPYYSLGWYFHRAREAWEDAATLIRQAQLRNPAAAEPLFGLGYIAARTGDNHTAEDCYRRALACDPHASGIWSNLAAILAQDSARVPEALAAWEKAVQEDPQHMAAWYLLYDNVVLHAPDRARDISDRALAANPQHGGAWRMRALLLSKSLDSKAEAVSAARKAVALEPDQPVNQFVLGLTLRESGSENLPQADAAFLQAAQRGYPAGWIQLFDIAAKQGDTARLEMLAHDFLAAAPAPVVLQFELAGIAAGASMEVAKLLIEHGAEREAVSKEDWESRGYFLTYYLERSDEGMEAFSRALALDSDDFVNQTNLLVLKSLSRGRNERSNDALEANLARHPIGAQALIRALGYLVDDDVGSAAREFEASLAAQDVDIYTEYEGFFDLFLKTGARRGHGEVLLEIFAGATFRDRFWPVVAAFEALVRGEDSLLSVNPEVRVAANGIYRRLSFNHGEDGGGRARSSPRRVRASSRRR